MGAGGGVTKSSRPETGSHSRCTLKYNCSSRPSQNAGNATPDTEKMRVRWSNQRSRYTADSMPRGTPSDTPSPMATSTSSKLAGKYRSSSCSTGLVETIERPRSPGAMPPR